MDPEGINMLSKISQVPYDFTHTWNVKKDNKINEQTKQKIHRYREQISGYQRGRGWGRVKWVKGVNHMVMTGNQTYSDGHAAVYIEVQI